MGTPDVAATRCIRQRADADAGVSHAQPLPPCGARRRYRYDPANDLAAERFDETTHRLISRKAHMCSGFGGRETRFWSRANPSQAASKAIKAKAKLSPADHANRP